MNEKNIIIPRGEDNIKTIINSNKVHMLHFKTLEDRVRITPYNINIIPTEKDFKFQLTLIDLKLNLTEIIKNIHYIKLKFNVYYGIYNIKNLNSKNKTNLDNIKSILEEKSSIDSKIPFLKYVTRPKINKNFSFEDKNKFKIILNPSTCDTSCATQAKARAIESEQKTLACFAQNKTKINLLENLLYYQSLLNTHYELLRERRNYNFKSLFYFKLLESIFLPNYASSVVNINLVPSLIQNIKYSNYNRKFMDPSSAYAVANAKQAEPEQGALNLRKRNKYSIYTVSKNELLFKNLKKFYSLIIKTKISKENVNPIHKKLMLHNISQFKKIKFYNKMKNLVNNIKKKFKLSDKEATAQALKNINSLDKKSEGTSVRSMKNKFNKQEKRLMNINNLNTKNSINKGLNNYFLRSEESNLFNVLPLERNAEQGAVALQSKRSKSKEAFVKNLISSYKERLNKPKKKRNKRRGKIITDKYRHNIFFPVLNKIKRSTHKNIYTISFKPYEHQVNILFKLHLSKILTPKYNLLHKLISITTNSTENNNKSRNFTSKIIKNNKLLNLRSKSNRIIRFTSKLSNKLNYSRIKNLTAFSGAEYSATPALESESRSRIRTRAKNIHFGSSQLTTPKYRWYTLLATQRGISNVLPNMLLLRQNKYNLSLTKNLLEVPVFDSGLLFNSILLGKKNIDTNKNNLNSDVELSKIGFDKIVYLNLIKKNMFSMVSLLNNATTGNTNNDFTSDKLDLDLNKLLTTNISYYNLNLSNTFDFSTSLYNTSVTPALTFLLKQQKAAEPEQNRQLLTELSNSNNIELTNVNKLLSIHKSIFSNYSYYNDLRSYNKPIRKDSNFISNEKKEYLKNYIISDWMNKKILLNNNNIFKNIKHELISNYFINKVFARRFKGFDSLAYEPKFELELFPYTSSDYWEAYRLVILNYLLNSSTFTSVQCSAGEAKSMKNNNFFNYISLNNNTIFKFFEKDNINNKNFLNFKEILSNSFLTFFEDVQKNGFNYINNIQGIEENNENGFVSTQDLDSQTISLNKLEADSPYLFTNSIEYSVPIHFDTRMTKNLFRDLINRNDNSSLIEKSELIINRKNFYRNNK